MDHAKDQCSVAFERTGWTLSVRADAANTGERAEHARADMDNNILFALATGDVLSLERLRHEICIWYQDGSLTGSRTMSLNDDVDSPSLMRAVRFSYG